MKGMSDLMLDVWNELGEEALKRDWRLWKNKVLNGREVHAENTLYWALDVLREKIEKRKSKGYMPEKGVIPIEYVDYLNVKKDVLNSSYLTPDDLKMFDEEARRIIEE